MALAAAVIPAAAAAASATGARISRRSTTHVCAGRHVISSAESLAAWGFAASMKTASSMMRRASQHLTAHLDRNITKTSRLTGVRKREEGAFRPLSSYKKTKDQMDTDER